MNKYNSEKAKERLLKRIRQDKRNMRKNLVVTVIQYTIVGLVFLGLGYGYHKMWVPNDGSEGIKNDKDSITLQLSDGTVRIISANKNISIINKNGHRVGLQKDDQLVYHRATTTEELVFNTIKVPYGKRFELVLADGTRAHLNSGTTLKYPVQFKYGKNREIFLRGEGFFEVAKDQGHPFIVQTEALNIKVLGTRFNVSAYPNDENINTVLVEGSVGLFEKEKMVNAENPHILDPGHMATLQKHRKKLTIAKTDTELYTGWMDGQLIFNNMPFREILKKLERNYNVIISNDYKELDEVQFTASFDTETIEQVLKAFNKNYPMQYTVQGNNIHIEKP